MNFVNNLNVDDGSFTKTYSHGEELLGYIEAVKDHFRGRANILVKSMINRDHFYFLNDVDRQLQLRKAQA